MNPLIQFKRISLPLLVVTVLVCLALSIEVEAGLRGPPPTCNTSDGSQALFSITTGVSNTAVGGEALFSDTTGSNNTAVGCGALEFNVDGLRNTAMGNAALASSRGDNNTAVGFHALFSATNGSLNTAVGTFALESDIGGNEIGGNGNSALGESALKSNTTGSDNTAVGVDALFTNTTGGGNTAVGNNALAFNTTGSNNIAIGNTSGSQLTTGDFNIDIGSTGFAGEANTIRLGTAFNPDLLSGQKRTFIAAIYGVTTTIGNAIPVVIDSGGQLGTVSSSERFKKDIGPMDKASEAILALKPVTFHYKNDTKGIPQFGLIAEEVAKVNPDLIVHDAKGDVYTVRYDAVNAMLLNEFLKEHQKVQRLEAALAAVNERLKAQDAKIDKVNAKVELAKSAPQTVLNQ